MSTPMAAVAAMQQDLDSAIARLQVLNARMRAAESLFAGLLGEIQSARGSFDALVQKAAGDIGSQGGEVAQRLTHTLAGVTQLAQFLQSTQHDLQQGHAPLVAGLQAHDAGLQTTAQALAGEHQAFMATASAFQTGAAQRIRAIDQQDQVAAQDYHAAVMAAAQNLSGSLAGISSQSASTLSNNLQALDAQALQPTMAHASDVARQVSASFDQSRHVFDREVAKEVGDFESRNRAQRDVLKSDTSSLVSSLSALGTHLDGLTTTLLQGGEDVQSMLDLSTVGIRSAIEAFESVQRLMDEIIGHMG